MGSIACRRDSGAVSFFEHARFQVVLDHRPGGYTVLVMSQTNPHLFPALPL